MTTKATRVLPLWKDDPEEESVGRVLGFGKNKTYELARTGQIPGVQRMGSNWLAIRSRFERWLDGEDEL